MGLRPLTAELIDHYRELGVWQDRTISQMVEDHAGRTPEKLAVADQHERLDYATLVARYQTLGSWLQDAGLEDGDVVAVQSANRVVLAIGQLACNWAGMVFLPLSSAFRQTEVGHLLGVARAKAVIVPQAEGGHDPLAVVRDVRDRLPELRLIGEAQDDRADFNLADFNLADVLATAKITGTRRHHDPDDARHAMITSGTTSLSRISLWSDNNLWTMLSTYVDAVGFSTDDLAVGIAPASAGSTGYVYPVMTPLMFGGSSILLEHWDAAAALRLLSEEQATFATAIPTQMIKMMQHPLADELDFSRFRVFNNAGAPLPADAAQGLERLLGCRIQSVYGASDGGVPTQTRYDDPPEKRHHTVGAPLPHTELRLVDDSLEDVSGGTGEILWRNGTKSYGYLNEPDRTEAMFHGDGWYRSGDLGILDEDGYLVIVGRTKDMILRGGQNIGPREIEDLLITHPLVSEVAVIGVPDPVYGERICACISVRGREELTVADVQAFLEAQHLEKYKWPELVEVFDTLPKSSGAKVSKAELRDAVTARNTTPDV